MKAFQHYAAEGYHVVRQAIPQPLVRNLAEHFRTEAKAFHGPLLRQSTRIEPTILDKHGFMSGALLDPHLHAPSELAAFKAAILDLACSAEMLAALRTVTLRPDHWLQQVMIFEQSVTPAHQDCVYLDSAPGGCLTAAWIALEDIHSDASRFFVIPGSQDFDRDFPADWIWGTGQYMKAMDEIVRTEFAGRVSVPEMRAGDALFWNSHLIHGSLCGADPSKSRLSLTAHYIPRGFGMGRKYSPVERAYPFPLVEGRPIAHLDRMLLP